MSTNVPETESTTVPETESTPTAAPAARKKPMARKPTKPAPYVPSAPLFSLETKEPFRAGWKKDPDDDTKLVPIIQEYSWYSVAGYLFTLGMGDFSPRPGRAEVALMVALYQDARGKGPGETAKEIDKMRDNGAMLMATIFAGLSGVPQDGMDSATVPHLAELHADYKVAWAQYIVSPEGAARMAKRRDKGATNVPDAKVSKYGYSGGFNAPAPTAKAKATGGQQALTQKEKQEALLEARERKKLGMLERAMGK